MIEWNEQQQMIQKMVRDFVAKEVVPNLDDIEYNGVPPYDILRKMIKTFGMDVMAKQNYEKQIAREKAAAENGEDAPTKKKDGPSEGAGDQAAMTMIPIIELSRHAQGLAHGPDIDPGTGALGIFALQGVGDAAGELDHLQAPLDVALGVGDHLAVLGRQQGGQLLHPRLDQALIGEHHPRPALRIDRGPGRLGGQGGLDG